MTEIVDRLEEVMSSVVSATYYRTLGINSLYAPMDNVKEFVRAPDNPFGGELVEETSGPFGFLHFPAHVSGPLDNYETWVWEDINVSGPEATDPITFDSWVFGDERNCVFVRKHFWDLHFLRAPLEAELSLKKNSLSLRNLLETSEESKEGILGFSRPLGITPLADLFKEREEGKVV